MAAPVLIFLTVTAAHATEMEEPVGPGLTFEILGKSPNSICTSLPYF